MTSTPANSARPKTGDSPNGQPHANTCAGGTTPDRGITRRRVLQGSAVATAGVAVASALPGTAAAHAPSAPPAPQGQKPGGPSPAFVHGVASGDPLPGSVLLWTRITSHPGDLPGKNRGTPTKVKWEVAQDPQFRAVVASGNITATPDTDMTVKPEAAGLNPGTDYYYRFTITDGDYTGHVSPVGRTRTAPAAGADVQELRFALFSCSNWEAGFFHAYGDMAHRGDIDYALHVGDYIYEYERGNYTGKSGPVRDHDPANEILTLADYRERYGQYHTDVNLQAAHAACPWIVTWDDHETANDAWSGGAENHQPNEGDWVARRDAAIQAYLEWLPVRATPFSQGGHLYRNLAFGSLVELNMLDLRTYRNKQPSFTTAREVDDENRTMMGSEQFTWLTGKLQSSTARWNFIGNSVMFTPVLIPPLDPQTSSAVTQLLGLPEQGMPYNFDQWDGYAAERRRLVRFLREKGIDNTVWLTGDIHSGWACDVPVEPAAYPQDGVAAVEFVCTSVTSSNLDDILKLPENNGLTLTAEAAFTNLNHHVRYLEYDSHGYNVVQVTPDFVHTDWIYIAPDGKLSPNSSMYYATSARSYHGKPGIQMLNSQVDPTTHSGR
ncbi:alkaline phosphatase D family protein [Corynebacterium heidelbergense]|uniref:Alkaline phosphatase n=1 Tax=Corynebacterium heidelbergense TaxID=2055947 RepID=A0A364V9H0_9CORY|nr:alkaline phosphatase D family protein [Corynebacterium heidelbergense]RAV33285.1 alkaline phosphatase [Corynebacterium heidelbergense]